MLEVALRATGAASSAPTSVGWARQATPRRSSGRDDQCPDSPGRDERICQLVYAGADRSVVTEMATASGCVRSAGSCPSTTT